MDFSGIEKRLHALLEVGTPGCALTVRQGHRELYRHVCGVSDRENGTPMTGEEGFYLFSCTKPITAAATMQLVERGLLSLNTPISQLIPAFAEVRVQEGECLVPPRTPITVRHLLTMSAGWDYDMTSPALREALATYGVSITTRQFAEAMAKKPLLFHPGDRFHYSLCHDVLGAVIEAAAGMSFGEWLRREIFEPLGMTHTGFAFRHPNRASLAAQYECPFDGAGYIENIGLEHPYRLGDNFESGGAGLLSTLDDYALFADAMACGGVGANGARILSEESIVAMRENQMGTFVTDPTFSCSTGPGYGYGLGVRTLIDKSQGQRSPLGEFGWDGANGAFIIIDPDNQLSFAFVQHVRAWPYLLGEFYAPIRDEVYDILGL